MKQINNGYCEYYYLTKDGQIYNKELDEYRNPDKDKRFYLKKLDGSMKRVSLRKLYDVVYDKPFCEDKIVDLRGEIWKEVENTNGLYYVSNMGRIKSYNGYSAMILKQTKTKSGYYRLDIVQNKQRVSKLVHRLVAFAFLPKPKNESMELHHKDFNKQNNRVCNLEWLPKEEHIKKHIERKKQSA